MFVLSAKTQITDDERHIAKVAKQSKTEIERWQMILKSPEKYTLSDPDRLSDKHLSIDHFSKAKYVVPVVAAKMFSPYAQACIQAKGLLPMTVDGSRYAAPLFGSLKSAPLPTPTDVLKLLRPFMKSLR
jgi:hypothetical protein